MLQQQYAEKHFFSSWAHLCRTLRADRIAKTSRVLIGTAVEFRHKVFQTLAGKLSGSESAYFIWHYNLMGDDHSRSAGITQSEFE